MGVVKAVSQGKAIIKAQRRQGPTAFAPFCARLRSLASRSTPSCFLGEACTHDVYTGKGTTSGGPNHSSSLLNTVRGCPHSRRRHLWRLLSGPLVHSFVFPLAPLRSIRTSDRPLLCLHLPFSQGRVGRSARAAQNDVAFRRRRRRRGYERLCNSVGVGMSESNQGNSFAWYLLYTKDQKSYHFPSTYTAAY